MFFDVHVHDRGGKQSEKETPAHALEVARDAGLDGIVVMPNTDPPLFTEELVRMHYQDAMSSGVKDVFYGIWMGLTSDPEQIKRAVDVQRKLPYVLGFKMYAGHSTGNLGIVKPYEQLRVFESLTEVGYDGPLLIHCEKESKMDSGVFVPEHPITHCFARPSVAETESISDQLYFARSSGFEGKLHIVHISTSEGVKLVNEAKRKGVDVSCGVCPHHLFRDYTAMLGRDGLVWKMNPPLRRPGESDKLLEALIDGRIDFLETDHAPHTHDDKFVRCASGVTALPSWPVFTEALIQKGFSERIVEEVTLIAAAERFDVSLNPKIRKIKDRAGDYFVNPWKDLEESIGWKW